MRNPYALVYVTDDSIRDDERFYQTLEAALKGGASMIQLREKSCSTRDFLVRAQKAKHICQLYQVPLVINDRVDIALACAADGVHLGQSDMPVEVVRALLPSGALVGLSVSSLEELSEAAHLEVDYLGVSPVFATATKTEDLAAPLGLEGLAQMRAYYSGPLVCIGGINLSNAASLMQHGASGVAVVSVISQAENPEHVTRELVSIVTEHQLNTQNI